MPDHINTLKAMFDGMSIGAVIATLFGWLPHIAALLSVVWTLIRIYETDTVQRLIKKDHYVKQG